MSLRVRSWTFCGLGLALFAGLYLSPAFQAGDPRLAAEQKRVFLKPWSSESSLREPAARGPGETEPVCYQNQRLDVAVLKQEIQEMEAALALARPAAGTRRRELIWNELDLSHFPVPQARYLTLNPDFFEVPEPRAVADCTDIYCVMDAVYGKKNSEEGVRLYHWYLRMGAPLAVSSKVPSYPPQSGEYQDGTLEAAEIKLSKAKPKLNTTLFRANELKAFSLLSDALSPLYRNMWSLKSIHRLPDGYGLGSSTSGIYNSGAGWSISRRTGAKSDFKLTAGAIRLVPSMMRISSSPRLQEDYGFEMIAHEMSHALDHILFSPKFDDYGYVSEGEEWLAMSGWRKVTITNPVTQKSTYQWDLAAGHEGFPSDYAGTRPEEDFAESAMSFRLFPEKMTELPLKSRYIADHIYQGRRFDADSLKLFYLQQLTSDASSRLPAMVEECSGQTACLDQQIQQSFERSIRTLQKSELEACEILDDETQSSLAGLGKEALIPKIGVLLENSAAVAKIRADIEAFQAYLRTGVDPREIYVSCYSQAAEQEACYGSALSTKLDSVAAAYSGESQSWISSEKEKYLKSVPFAVARARVEQDTDEVLAGARENLTLSLLTLWDRCVQSTGEPASAALTPFSGGEQYVSLSILDCVNASLKSELRAVAITQVSRPELVPASPFYDIAVERLLRKGTQILAGFLAKDAAEELMAHSNKKPAVIAQATSQLRAMNPDDLKVNCASLAAQEISNQLNSGFTFKFTERVALEKSWAETLCKNLSQ